jgi:hypothetical protein
MCIPAYVLLKVCMVMNVIVKNITEYEQCGRLECVALCSIYQRTHCYIPEDCNPECGVVCVLINHLSPSVLIGFHITKRFSGLVLVTSVCRLLISS